MKVDFQLKGWEEFQARLSSSPSLVAEARKKMLTKGSFIAKRKAKEKPPMPVDTGILRGSVKRRVQTETAIIGTNVKYAPYQEYGTKRGIRPKRFMQKGLEEVNNQIHKLEQVMKDIIKGLSF